MTMPVRSAAALAIAGIALYGAVPARAAAHHFSPPAALRPPIVIRPALAPRAAEREARPAPETLPSAGQPLPAVPTVPANLPGTSPAKVPAAEPTANFANPLHRHRMASSDHAVPIPGALAF